MRKSIEKAREHLSPERRAELAAASMPKLLKRKSTILMNKLHVRKLSESKSHSPSR